MIFTFEKIISLIYYFLESYLLVMVALMYIGIKSIRSKLTIFSLVFGLSTFLLKDIILPYMKVPEGFHSLPLFFLNILFLFYIFRMPLVVSVICDFLFFVTIIIIETINLFVFQIFGFSPEIVASSIYVKSAVSLLNLVLLLCIAAILLWSKFVFVPINRFYEKR